MRLSVPTNFDDALLDGIARYPVTDVYGKLTRDPIGGPVTGVCHKSRGDHGGSPLRR